MQYKCDNCYKKLSGQSNQAISDFGEIISSGGVTQYNSNNVDILIAITMDSQVISSGKVIEDDD